MTSRSLQTPSATPTPLHTKHPEQAGAIGGLSDMALAVVVGTLTLVGVVGFFQTSSSGAKSNAEIANFTALISNIRSAYWQAGTNFTAISNANLINSRIAPANLISGGNALVPVSGNTITVAPVQNRADQFTVAYEGIPRETCIKLVTTSSRSVSNVVSITVESTTTNDSAFPIDLGTATSSCSSDNNNKITWTIGH